MTHPDTSVTRRDAGYTGRFVPPRPSTDTIPGGARPAALVRTVSTGGGVAVRAIIGSNLIAEAMSIRQMAPTAINALGRLMMGAVLIAVGSGDEREDETVQVQLRGDGPLGSLVAISDWQGRVRGTVSQPAAHVVLKDGSPDVARAIGLGTLTVVRHRPAWREPYSGTVPLVSGEVAGDLTLYLTESEQTPSAMGLGVSTTPDASAVVAAGFLVQILPDASSEEVDVVEANVQALPRLSDLVLTGTDADDLTDRLLAGVGSRARHASAPVFHCPCTRKRALRTLQLLGDRELGEMVVARVEQEVRCQFCGRAYTFLPDEIGALIPEA